MKKIVTISLLLCIMVLAGCMKETTESHKETVDTEPLPAYKEEDSLLQTTTLEEEFPQEQTTTVPERIEVSSLLFCEFNDFRDTYDYEPEYSAEQWMNAEGALLFPYVKEIENTTSFVRSFALLYMPDEVLVRATTQDLLKVVMDGWLEASVTSISVFSTPSHYILSCTGKNQASNELLRRSDMIDVLYNDYCNRDYSGAESLEGKRAADKLQFDEIILASNHAFSLMDDHMKRAVLTEALEKYQQVKCGEYYTVGHTSGFFAFIAEEERNGGSYWYKYICDNNIEEAKLAISFDEVCWLEQFY